MPAAAIFSIILAAITVLVLAPSYRIKYCARSRAHPRQAPGSQHRPSCGYQRTEPSELDRWGY